MTGEEIKAECELIFEQNKKNEERLEELRKNCKHEKTFEGNYSWRVGNIRLAELCFYCHKFIKYKE